MDLAAAVAVADAAAGLVVGRTRMRKSLVKLPGPFTSGNTTDSVNCHWPFARVSNEVGIVYVSGTTVVPPWREKPKVVENVSMEVVAESVAVALAV